MGYDVISISEMPGRGMSDEDVYALTLREQAVLITRDYHFTNPIRFPVEKNIIIYIRHGNLRSEEEIKAAPQVEYPYMIDSDGVIPLDEGHPEDLAKRIMDAISITFGESKSHEIAKEIEEIIGTKLRKYLEKKFFSSHINRYLKRPIYWQRLVKRMSFLPQHALVNLLVQAFLQLKLGLVRRRIQITDSVEYILWHFLLNSGARHLRPHKG